MGPGRLTLFLIALVLLTPRKMGEKSYPFEFEGVIWVKKNVEMW